MRRVLMIAGTLLFGIGALAGASLVVMLLVDGEHGEAGRVALGTVALAGAARGFRLGWRRANQEREFRRESRRDAASEKMRGSSE